MKKIILKDFEKWKALNKDEFSLFDYIFHITNRGKINSDIFFAFSEMFWPSFVIYKEYILLDGAFSEKKTEELIRRNENVEFWMNLFITDPFFEDDEDGEERAEFLAKSLVETWKSKLIKEFPDKNFIVQYVCDQECGDYGLTFYQTSHDTLSI